MILSKSQYAAHRGVSPAAVTKAVKIGRIPVTADGRIDVEAADRAWGENTHPFKGGGRKGGAEKMPVKSAEPGKRKRGRPPKVVAAKPASSPAMQRRGRPPKASTVLELEAELATLGIPGGKVPTLNASRAIYEQYRAKSAQIEYEERIGQLVPLEKVKKEAFAMARITRDALLAIPDRLASEIAGITDQFEIHARIAGEIKAALAEIDRAAHQ